MKSKLNGELVYYLWSIGKAFFLIFIISSLLFGILRTVKVYSLIEGISNGVLFGIFLSVILTVLMTVVDLIERFRCFKKFKKVSFRVQQKRRIFVHDDYNRTYQLLLETIKRIGLELETQNIQNGVIKATTRRSWRSVGERIIITINKFSNVGLLVELSSRPIFFTTLFDYCKNFYNIEILLMSLKKAGMPIKNNEGTGGP